MRSKLTTTSPCAATAPPDRPVRPPEGTSAIRRSNAQRAIACTCATSVGNATASGAGRQRRVQSRP